MIEKKLQPLDTLLRIFYTKKHRNSLLALKYVERAAEFSHPIRINYIYPLFLAAHSSKHWNDDDRLRLYRFLDRSSIEFESNVFLRILQSSFQRFYSNDLSSFFQLLRENQLEKLLENFSSLLNNETRRCSSTSTRIRCDLTDEFIEQLTSCSTTNSNIDDLKIFEEKLSKNFDEKVFGKFFEFFSSNVEKLTRENLETIGKLLLDFRPNEPLRRFWKKFFENFYIRTNVDVLLEFYSNALKQNPKLPYLPLFDLFIRENLLDHLQKVVDLASAQHGSQNVSHDLAFTMIRNGKTKQAERIFQISWFRPKNERIRLHSLLFAEEKNLSALIDAIKLTRDLPGVEQKSLFNAAIRFVFNETK